MRILALLCVPGAVIVWWFPATAPGQCLLFLVAGYLCLVVRAAWNRESAARAQLRDARRELDEAAAQRGEPSP